MSIQIQPTSLDLFTDSLATQRYFSFARYGDGEFECILGKQGENCDGHFYFEKLANELRLTLTQAHKQNYYYALGPKAARGMRVEVSLWLQRYAKRLLWWDTEVLLKASVNGTLLPFVDALRNQVEIVLVGPKHLQFLQTLLPNHQIEVPTKNAFLYKREILQSLHNVLSRCRPSVVLFSAGMLSKVLIWELFPTYGDSMMLWDTGSLFDMYCNVNSRSYARRMPKERKLELLQLNFSSTALQRTKDNLHYGLACS